jgi:hypothetical protein
MSEGPDPGTAIVAIFLILFGVCISLAGGGCTLFMLVNIVELFRYDGGSGLFLLFLSLGTLVIGIVLVRTALRMLRPRDE